MVLLDGQEGGRTKALPGESDSVPMCSLSLHYLTPTDSDWASQAGTDTCSPALLGAQLAKYFTQLN